MDKWYIVARKKIVITVIVMKETLKETNRLKSKCSVNSSIYALLKGHGLLLLIRKGYMAITPNSCTKQHRNNTETSHANMRYAKSLTPSPTVAIIYKEGGYRGRRGGIIIIYEFYYRYLFSLVVLYIVIEYL